MAKKMQLLIIVLMCFVLNDVQSQASETCDSGTDFDTIWPFHNGPDDSQLTCAPDWKRRGAYCYRLYNDILTRSNAQLQCESEGGELVKLEDASVIFFNLREILRGPSGNLVDYAWTGLEIEDWDNCTGSWVDGTLGGCFNGQWEADRPQEGLGNCVAVSSCTGLFTNRPCSQTMPSICQQVACRTGEFHCTNDKCIQGSRKCDNFNDCGDLSDELLDECDQITTILTLTADAPSDSFTLNTYKNNDEQYIKIEGPPGSKIQAKLESFVTEADKDVLDVYAGGSTFTTSRFVTSLSGSLSDPLPQFISENNLMLFRFTTDVDEIPAGGTFEISVTIEFSCEFSAAPVGNYMASESERDESTADDENTCVSDCLSDENCVAVTFVTGDQMPCRKHKFINYLMENSDAKFYRKSCPGEVTEDTSQILPNGGGKLIAKNVMQNAASPYYPKGELYKKLEIQWDIEAEKPGSVITITALDMDDLAEGDVVKIFDGAVQDESKKLAEYRSDTIGKSFVVTTGSSAIVTYKSESDTPGGGINFGYKQGCGAVVITRTADFCTPGADYTGSPGYPDLLSCDFEIFSKNLEEPLIMSFGSFFEIKAADSLKVFTGELDKTAEPMFPYIKYSSVIDTGDQETLTAPTNVWNSTSYLKITFNTNGVGAGKGFCATVSGGCGDLNITDPNIRLYDQNGSPITKIPREFNSSVSITCVEGYYLAAEEFGQCPSSDSTNWYLLVCGKNGLWNAPRIPVCTKQVCGLPPTVFGGYMTNLTGVETNDTATYSCIPGLEMAGTGVATCQSGQWESVPTCTGGECSVPANQTNGYYKVLSGEEKNGKFSQDSIIEFVCDPGYYLTKAYRAVCSGGNFVGDTDAKCDALSCKIPDVQRGTVVSKENPPNDQFVPHDEDVEVVCDEGYVIFNTTDKMQTFKCDRSATDMPDGTFGADWKMNMRCVDDDECNNTNTVNKCSQECINTEGSYRCECNEGYKLNMDHTTCSDIDECSYLKSIEDCVDTEDKKCLIQRCQLCNNNVEGSFACECVSGFHLWDGIETPQYPPGFGESGMELWHMLRENVSCVRNTCNDSLPAAEAGMTRITFKAHYFFGDKVEYLCPVGTSVGSTTKAVQYVECGSTGDWMNPDSGDGTLVNCSTVNCDGVDISSLQARNDLVVPKLPAGANDPQPFSEIIDFNCTIPGAENVDQRRLQCVFDKTNDTYRLVGDSLECKKIDCGPVPLISGMKRGSLNPAQTFYGDQFDFECEDAFVVSGNSNFSGGATKVSCRSNGKWSLGDLTCIGPACPDPGTPPDAEQVAVGSAEISYEVGFTVGYNCLKSGFSYSGTNKTCTVNGNSVEWDGADGVCEDVQKPEFTNCPTDPINLQTYQILDIPIPSTSDNVAVETVVSNFPVGTPVTSGLTSVNFTATDFNGNEAVCSVTVIVSDPGPPLFNSNCTIEREIVIGDGDSPITETIDTTFLETLLDENEIQKLDMDKTMIDPQTFTVGKADVGNDKLVIITVANHFNETSTCTLLYKIQAAKCAEFALSLPTNVVEKSSDTNEKTLECKDDDHIFGAGYETSTEITYSCDPNGDGIWKNVADTYVPDCALKIPPKFEIDITVFYKLENSADIDETCQNSIRDLVKTQAFLDQEENFIDNVPNAVFDKNNPDGADCRMVRDSITVPAVNRDGSIQFLIVTYRYTLSNQPNKIATPSQRSSCENSLKNRYVEYYVESSRSNTHTTIVDASCGDTLSAIGTLTGKTEVDVSSQLECTGPGEVLFDSSCAKCAPGYHVDNTSTPHVCVKCAQGKYQDVAGQDSCKMCDAGKSTSAEGAQKSSQCIDQCPPGFINGVTGLSPCQLVGIDHYWFSSTAEEDCPGGTKNPQMGGKGLQDCRAECSAGQYSASGFAPCQPCPRGFHQMATGSVTCTPCMSPVSTTPAAGATSNSECTTNATALCSGTCGDGTCIVQDNAAVCKCNAGYSGLECENPPNPCKSSPCYNGGDCIGFENNTYVCLCDGTDIPRMELHDNKTDLTKIPDDDGTQVLAKGLKTYQSCQVLCKDQTDCYYSIFYGDVNPSPDLKKGCYLVLREDFETLQTKDVPSGDDDFKRYLVSKKIFDTTPFFQGDRCEYLVEDPCAGQCMNNASCHVLGHELFQCICRSDSLFGGTYCNVSQDICQRELCYNGAVCNDDFVIRRTCDCAFGYDTDNCNRSIDYCNPNPCLYSGECTLNLGNGLGYECGCNDGFEGTKCETVLGTVCDGITCADGKDCYPDPVTSKFACVCAEGKTFDPVTEQCQPINMCDMNPCFHNGTCVPLPNEPAGFKCTCLTDQYRGAQCQAKFDPCAPEENLCDLTHSVCRIDVNGTGYCECDPGYKQGTKPYCGTTKNLCDENFCNATNLLQCDRDGVNDVNVNDYDCICADEFTGRHCEVLIRACDTQPCIHGDCQNIGNSFTCQCESGWTGTTCDAPIELCEANTCGAGTCYTLFNDTKTCACVPGEQYGDTCENEINACLTFSSTLCDGKGTCELIGGKATCNCQAGQSGDSCQCQKDFCSDANACKNGGTCIGLTTTYECICAPGFTGQDCGQNIDDCAALAGCPNCVDGINVAYCRCSSQMTGRTCSKAANYDYDLKVTGVGGSKLLYPAIGNTTQFSLVAFIRFRKDTPGQPIRICAADDETKPECTDGTSIITIHEDSFCINNQEPGSCFQEGLGLNDGVWHRLIFTSGGAMGQLRLDGTFFTAKAAQISLPEFVMIILAEEEMFQGSLHRLEMYDYSLPEADIATVLKNGMLANSPFIPWDFYEIVGIQYVAPSEYCIGSCSGQGNRNPPEVDECPVYGFAQKTKDVPRIVVNWDDPVFKPSSGLVVENNFRNNDDLDGGAYNIVYRATNAEQDISECRFSAYVSYDMCPTLAPTDTVTFTCDHYADGLFQSCTPSCIDSANFVFLEPVPRKINCGPSGVFDPNNPTDTFQISECGRRCDSLLDIKFSWNYTSTSPLAQSDLDNMKDDVQKLIKEWDDDNAPKVLCTDASCSNIDLNIHYDDPSLQVQVMAPSAKTKSTRSATELSSEILIKEAIDGAQKSFDVMTMPGTRTFAINLVPGSLDYMQTVSCNEPGCQPQTDYCVECTAGTYLNTTAEKCMPCMVGSFQNMTGQESCYPCPTGTTTEQEGARSPDSCFDICSAGQKYDKENQTCTDCGFGSYQPEPGQTFCNPCEFGTTTLVTNATNATQCKTACDDGQELGTDNVQCMDCKIGTYRTKDVHARCVECSGARTTPAKRSVSAANCSINVCQPGEYRIGDDPGNCTLCDLGTWRADGMNATECAPCMGWAEMPGEMYTTVTTGDRDMLVMGATNYTQCRPMCPEGKYINMTSGACIPCPKNTYKNETDGPFLTECIPCKTPRVFTQGEGSTSEDECQFNDCMEGQIVNVTDASCIDCPVGFYQPEPNPTNHTCIICPMKNNLATTTENPKSTSEADCKEICPDGMEIVGGVCTPCKYGFYKNNDADAAAKFGNCTACPNNTTADMGSTDVSNCTIADCGPGEFLNSSNNECQLCAAGTYQSVDWRTVTPANNMDPYIRTCKICDPDTFTDGEGKQSKSDCKKVCESGKEDLNGTCTACERGKYKDNSESLYSECKTCMNGKITLTEGSTSADNCSIAACPPGQYRKVDNICHKCEKHTYNSKKWREGNCTPCGKDTDGRDLGTVETGATSADNCTAHPKTVRIQVKITIRGRFPYDEQIKPASIDERRTRLLSRFIELLKKLILQLSLIFKGIAMDHKNKAAFSVTRGSSILVGQILVDSTGSGILLENVVAKFQELLEAVAANPNDANLKELAEELQGSGAFTAEAGADGVDPGDALSCPAGKQLVVTQGTGETFEAKCEDCPENTYYEPGNIAVCSKCPEGTISSPGQTGIDNCKLTCEAGNYSKGGIECVECELNSYKETKGTGSCDNCPMTSDNPPKQQITLQKGSTDPEQCLGSCDRGFYYQRTPGNKCVQCPRGKYQDQVNKRSCIQCDTYYYTATQGSVASSACQPVCGPNGVYPGYCMNGGSCDWNEALKIALCSCVEPYQGERCETRGEPKSDTNIILIAVFSALGGLLLLLLLILAIRYYYVKKGKKEDHEDRKNRIRQIGNTNTPYGQLQSPPVMAPMPYVAPMPVAPTYFGATYQPYGADDMTSLPGYGMRQTGNPTPPGTLHGFHQSYAQNPQPSMFDVANPNKAVYYDEKEPDFPKYGTQGFQGGRGLYGTNIYNRGTGGSVFQGNY